MKKENFDSIKQNLTNHIDNCKKHLDHIKTTADLCNITLQEALDLQAFVKQELADMTEICMVEFYHIIGMGELDAIQTRTFIKLFKEYTSYRSDIKSLANQLHELNNLPNLPTQSKYTLKILGNFTLKSTIRGRAESTEVFEDTEQYTDRSTIVKPKTVEDEQSADLDLQYIQINPKSSLDFTVIDLAKVSSLLGTTPETITQKALNYKTYYGITWRYLKNTDEIKGIFSGEASKNCFIGRMKGA